MKESKKPISKEKKIAIGFTIGVHVVAITGLLFLGLTKPPTPPQTLKTVLVKPEDLVPPEPKPLIDSEFSETAHQNVEKNIQQTSEPVKNAPPIPVAPPVPEPKVEPPKPNVQAAEAAKAKQEAERKAAAEAQREAANNAARQAKSEAEAKAKALADQKNRQEQQQKIRADAALKAKQEAERKAKADEAKAKQAADRKAQADADAKAKREADRKSKAAEDAKAKVRAESDAKAKAEVDAKARQDAKAKAEADAKARQDAKAKADAEAKARAEAEARESSAQKAKEEAANKKAESKRVASSAKRDFEQKIKNVWRMPLNSSGQKATARVTLSESGAVTSVFVNASDPDVKASVEQAVRSAAPYPMPSDPDARREARSFTSSFTVK